MLTKSVFPKRDDSRLQPFALATLFATALGACVVEESGPMCGDDMCEAAEADTCSADCDQPLPAECGNTICEMGDPAGCEDCAVGDATLRVQNSSSYTIWYVYLASCSASSWGSDLLGADVLSPGVTLSVTEIPPGCYDFRAETQESSLYWERYGTTLVGGQTTTWTLTN